MRNLLKLNGMKELCGIEQKSIQGSGTDKCTFACANPGATSTLVLCRCGCHPTPSLCD